MSDEQKRDTSAYRYWIEQGKSLGGSDAGRHHAAGAEGKPNLSPAEDGQDCCNSRLSASSPVLRAQDVQTVAWRCRGISKKQWLYVDGDVGSDQLIGINHQPLILLADHVRAMAAKDAEIERLREQLRQAWKPIDEDRTPAPDPLI